MVTCGLGRTKVVVVGQGYVGLALSLAAADAGYLVVGFDTDATKIGDLSRGISPVGDEHSLALLRLLQSGNYRPTLDPGDLAGFDIAVICVPTPLHEAEPDLSFVGAACDLLAPNLREGVTVVLESTSYPGTTTGFVVPRLDALTRLRGGTDYHVGFSPERIDPSNKSWTIKNTPKVVSGVEPCCLEAISEFYARCVDVVVPVSSPEQAEMTKLLENSFRQVNIAFINELSALAVAMQCDLGEVIAAASTKPFGFMPFFPGPGVGGHCLPIDPVYLSWAARNNWGTELALLDLAARVNAGVPGLLVDEIVACLAERGRGIEGARVLVLGLAYKRNSADVRSSPAVEIASRLVGLGAEVSCADPLAGAEATPSGCTFVEDPQSAARGADLCLLLVPHDAFDTEELSRAAGTFLDCSRGLGSARANLLRPRLTE